MTDLQSRARRIKLLCTDVDGVLTDGSLQYGLEPGHSKAFSVRDGAGIKWLQRAGIPVAFISGLESPSTWNRAKQLDVVDCFAGHLDKLPILEQLCAKYGLDLEEVAHVGDDLHDLPLLKRVGLAACPEDAVPEVRAASHWIVPLQGGHGVLRALVEEILKAKGLWDDVVGRYSI
jgi:3-deoxy-D-manno-octulosonate 8-phosphate phosphatase (KDO 8-P phosphatase)